MKGYRFNDKCRDDYYINAIKIFFFIVVIFVLLCMHENGKQRKIPTAKHVGR